MSAYKELLKGPLKSKLIELIRLKGPLTVADYMKIVLTNPESGFYMNNDVFGVKGHFTTNPEVSQIFGEILGVWILQEWRRFKCPRPLRLVEFGPGRGTLMADITRTIRALDPEDIQIGMIELSPKLISIQKETLSQRSNLLKQTKWFSHLEELNQDENGFTAYIAHEFLDALPIHKFVRDPKTKGWRELLIDYDDRTELRFCIARQPSLAARLLVPQDFQGDHIEVCPEAALQLERVAKRLNSAKKGCMLVCDYGFEDEPESAIQEHSDRITSLRPIRSDRDTFRAFKNHETWPPLKEPGEADLTADVDFGFLKKHLKDKALIHGSIDQKSFLTNCGLAARLNKLLDKADVKEKEYLQSGAHMICEDMGQRYRFLSLHPQDCDSLFAGDPPAGFMKNNEND